MKPLLALILTLTAPLYASPTAADTLQAILERPELKSRTNREKTEVLMRYVDPQSNYGRLVLETGPISLLEEWIGPLPQGYKLLKNKIKRNHNLMDFTRVYRHNKTDFEFHVKIFVPYPTCMDSVHFGLIKEFTSLEPPALSVDSAEDKIIRGLPAKLFYRRDRSTSLFFKLNRNSVLNFISLKVDGTSEMLRFASLLDISGLNEHLGT